MSILLVPVWSLWWRHPELESCVKYFCPSAPTGGEQPFQELLLSTINLQGKPSRCGGWVLQADLQSCIVHPGPRPRGGFPEFLDCLSLEQLRKHLGLFDPLGRQNKYLEGRNFCGIFPKSEGSCVALAQEVTGVSCPWLGDLGTGPLVAFLAIADPQERLGPPRERISPI